MSPNELIHESSPYLLQHAYNPVNWFAWGEKALSKAKAENKLILISIGYSACHWCHVMERESFEDPETAEIMNKLFVCIKVDREERPDLDQVYLEAVQIMTGHGGWPLNCFTLPDQTPVYGGTYFRKEDWKNILLNLAAYWRDRPEEAKSHATELVKELGYNRINHSNEKLLLPDALRFLESWKPYLDQELGGFRGEPKFPLPISWDFLFKLKVFLSSPDTEYLDKFLKLTLEKMATGGIYDAIGGGFARYSTDAYWFAPHFEKMLYDNAQLISLYSQAFIYHPNPEYKSIVINSIRFLSNDLLSEEGAYFSALDADSEGVEGKYYTWSQTELKTLLGSLEPVFSLYFHVIPKGNWENSNILYRKSFETPLADKLGLSSNELLKEIDLCRRTLLTHRYTRIKPELDDKILTSWNALLISGFCDAFRAFGEDSLLDSALKIANFLFSKMKKGHQILRTYKNGIAKISGFLDDYAFLAEASIHLYQVSFDESWIYKAERLLDHIKENFADPQNPLYYYTSKLDSPLITRKKEIQDSVIPSSNSVLAKVLLRLGHYLDRLHYKDEAKAMLLEVQDRLLKQGHSYSNWSSLALELMAEPWEITIIGPKAHVFRAEIERKGIPFKWLSGKMTNHREKSGIGKNENVPLPILADKLVDSNKWDTEKTLIYLCRNQVCGLPLHNIEGLMQEVNQV